MGSSPGRGGRGGGWAPASPNGPSATAGADATAAAITAKRTLYEVLGAPPEATKADLKARYVALAKVSHPDAQIGRIDGEGGSIPDFNEVATAWKLLSDPKERKRYDRTLRAERLTAAAEESINLVAPQFRSMIENVAVPLLRRTTATAVATVSAVADDISGKGVGVKENNVTKNATFGSAINSAVQASRKAGRAIDRLELQEKSRELEAR